MIHVVLSFHVCLQYEPLTYLSICLSSHKFQLLFIHTSLLTWEPGLLELNCIQNRICVIYVIKHTHTHTYIHTHTHTYTHTHTHRHFPDAVQPLSRVQLFVTPWTIARQAPLSMGFSRQEYWRELPFPSSESFPDPGIKPASPALAGQFFITEPSRKNDISTYISVFIYPSTYLSINWRALLTVYQWGILFIFYSLYFPHNIS